MVINDEMVHRVLDVFPQFSPQTIRQDLMRTRSPERTIERILNGRLQEQPQALDDVNALDGVLQPDVLDDDLQWDLSTLWSALWGERPRGTSDGHGRPNSPTQRQGHQDPQGFH
jgi:hypothetical protein